MTNKLDKVVGIVYNALLPEAFQLAGALSQRLSPGTQHWVCSAAEVEDREADLKSAGLLITIGGDGTILRAVRVAAPRSIPILGVNLGRVGFMTELGPQEALERIGFYTSGDGWVEERAMLQAQVWPENSERQPGGPPPLHALNDVVVGRAAISRLVHIEVKVDGTVLTTYSADAVVVATATGSTGYSLAAGGPILHAQSKDILVTAVAPHLTLAPPLVLPSTAVLELTLLSEQQAMLSLDGFTDLALAQGDTVEVRHSPYVARFLRSESPTKLYASLARRLGLEGRPYTPRR